MIRKRGNILYISLMVESVGAGAVKQGTRTGVASHGTGIGAAGQVHGTEDVETRNLNRGTVTRTVKQGTKSGAAGPKAVNQETRTGVPSRGTRIGAAGQVPGTEAVELRSPELKAARLKSQNRSPEALPVVEAFYTIQGEGHNSGKAAYFIRLAGCDVGCSWCDSKESWDQKKYPLIEIDTIIEQLLKSPAKNVVITGGEPLKHNLDILCQKIKKHKIKLFLETSGTEPISGKFDWICLSPKKKRPPKEELYKEANEIKIVVETPADFTWAEQNKQKVSSNCELYLQPEWSRSKEILPQIIEYVKEHPEWKVSLQTHKYMNIP